MRSIWLKRAGIVLGALVALGFALRVFIALGAGKPFVGNNYWGAPIGTYLAIPVLVIGLPIGLWWCIRGWRK